MRDVKCEVYFVSPCIFFPEINNAWFLRPVLPYRHQARSAVSSLPPSEQKINTPGKGKLFLNGQIEVMSFR